VVASRPGEDALVDEAMSVGTPIQNATALVTGGFRGFGAAVVDELLHRGAAKVYATSRTISPMTIRWWCHWFHAATDT
jgi:NAD(P)-dependent dehydrogenase (short-subunit alcohol dehydrogenase family)